MKLIQFTDFHLRLTPAPESQFHLQPFWRGDTRELFSRIGKISQDADAIVFTGDATHGGGRNEVAQFFDLLAATASDKPVFMVLGNHDVVDPDWEDHFHRGIEPYRNFHLLDGVYQVGEIDIALINNEYLTAEYLRGTRVPSTSWRGDCFPAPAMTQQQATRLDAGLSAGVHRPAIALIHCPSHVVPATLYDTGAGGVLSAMDQYRETLHGVMDKHPRIGMVLSGHVHFNSTQIYKHGRVHHSLASATEYPYQIRIVEINENEFQSKLASLAAEADVEESKTLGRES